jgi:hypothetical protein
MNVLSRTTCGTHATHATSVFPCWSCDAARLIERLAGEVRKVSDRYAKVIAQQTDELYRLRSQLSARDAELMVARDLLAESQPWVHGTNELYGRITRALAKLTKKDAT